MMLNASFFFLLIVLGIVAYFEIYAFAVFTPRDYLVWEDPKTWDYDKSNLVFMQLNAGGEQKKVPLQSQVELTWTSFLVYNDEN